MMKQMNFGKRIKEIFEKSGMTITELANRTNTSRTNIYYIFGKDDLTVGQLQLFSKALGHDFLREFVGIE